MRKEGSEEFSLVQNNVCGVHMRDEKPFRRSQRVSLFHAKEMKNAYLFLSLYGVDKWVQILLNDTMSGQLRHCEEKFSLKEYRVNYLGVGEKDTFFRILMRDVSHYKIRSALFIYHFGGLKVAKRIQLVVIQPLFHCWSR